MLVETQQWPDREMHFRVELLLFRVVHFSRNNMPLANSVERPHGDVLPISPPWSWYVPFREADLHSSDPHSAFLWHDCVWVCALLFSFNHCPHSTSCCLILLSSVTYLWLSPCPPLHHRAHRTIIPVKKCHTTPIDVNFRRTLVNCIMQPQGWPGNPK